MAAPSYTLNIVDSIHVSAPAGSVPTTTLPLTYLDIPWFTCAPMQSLFFYQFPHPTSHFIQSTLPTLKHSLSLTLQHFFPLAAKLMCPPPPLKPYILYTKGDSVPLVVAESNADFNHLIAKYPRDIKLLHPFASELPPSTMSSDGVRVLPIMAIKVTVFPNTGVCIGLTHNHVAADGSAFMHFVRSWSSVCKLSGDSTFLDDVSRRPFHNKDAFNDTDGSNNEEALKLYGHWISSWRENLVPTKEISSLDHKVRATFVLTRAQIDRLKRWLGTQCKNNDNDSEELKISTFVVTCSIIWICMIKSQENNIEVSSTSNNDDDDTFYYFLFAVDCRYRTEFRLPVTYFGNFIAPGLVRAKKGELMGANGIVIAAKAIAKKVKEMESGALKELDNVSAKLEEMFRSGHHVAISGSPKFGVYDMDFGWGRPMKIEFIHIDDGASLALIDSRDESGGMEVTLVLSKNQMDAFTSNLAKSLKTI